MINSSSSNNSTTAIVVMFVYITSARQAVRCSRFTTKEVWKPPPPSPDGWYKIWTTTNSWPKNTSFWFQWWISWSSFSCFGNNLAVITFQKQTDTLSMLKKLHHCQTATIKSKAIFAEIFLRFIYWMPLTKLKDIRQGSRMRLGVTAKLWRIWN